MDTLVEQLHFSGCNRDRPRVLKDTRGGPWRTTAVLAAVQGRRRLPDAPSPAIHPQGITALLHDQLHLLRMAIKISKAQSVIL